MSKHLALILSRKFSKLHNHQNTLFDFGCDGKHNQFQKVNNINHKITKKAF